MEVQTLPWAQFKDTFKWKQGEHLSLLGTTGSGKTTLARELLELRKYVIVLSTKPKDDTLDEFRNNGYKEFTTWNPHPDLTPHYIYAPKPKTTSKTFATALAEEFQNALYQIYKAKGWCVYVDEAAFMTRHLRLKEELAMLLTQGRSMGITVVSGTQRPFHIPLECYDQATHLFFWRQTDKYNLRRMAQTAGLSGKVLLDEVPQLEKHQFLYLNTRSGVMFKSKLEL